MWRLEPDCLGFNSSFIPSSCVTLGRGLTSLSLEFSSIVHWGYLYHPSRWVVLFNVLINIEHFKA